MNNDYKRAITKYQRVVAAIQPCRDNLLNKKTQYSLQALSNVALAVRNGEYGFQLWDKLTDRPSPYEPYELAADYFFRASKGPVELRTRPGHGKEAKP